jgi:hypothetical protein
MPLRLSNGGFEEIYDYMTIILAVYSDPLHPFIATLLSALSSDFRETYEQASIVNQSEIR